MWSKAPCEIPIEIIRNKHNEEEIVIFSNLYKIIDKILVNKKNIVECNRFIFWKYLTIYLNKAFIKSHFGILKIINKSSKILLLFDKNFIATLEDPSKILKNI